MTTGAIAGIILAGGASRRMGAPKALLDFRGETFLDRLIRLFSSAVDPVIVVVGHHGDQIRAGIKRAADVSFIVNPDPERGMLSSLQCGLAALPSGTEAVLFTPVDHPHIETSTLEQLIARLLADRSLVAIPTYNARHGHPVAVTRPVIDELRALPVSAQASDVIHRYAGQTSYVEVGDPAVLADVDNQKDYADLIAGDRPPRL